MNSPLQFDELISLAKALWPERPDLNPRTMRENAILSIVCVLITEQGKVITMDTNQGEAYEGWAILEIMGHRRLGGHVRQVEQYGTAMIRIDVPGENGDDATQFYGGGSIYCVTPTTEEIARGLAKSNRPAPVNTWDLPKTKALPAHEDGEIDPGWCPDCQQPDEVCLCEDDRDPYHEDQNGM